MTPSPNRILFATTEITPISKAGGLGDVSSALPKALAALGNDIRIITPLYGSIDREPLGLSSVSACPSVWIDMGESSYHVHFFEGHHPDSKLPIYFVDAPVHFGRHGIYNDPETGEGYWDNPSRFLLFSKAVVLFIQSNAFRPTHVHLNDSHVGMVAPMLRTTIDAHHFADIGIVFTIHNIQHQGRHPQHFIDEAGLDRSLAYHGGPLEFWGDVNFMKAGISFADRITTVSETYAHETRSSFDYGFGLEGVLQNRGSDYIGILNGVDTSDWNPETDPHLSAPYSVHTFPKKRDNKRALLSECGLDESTLDRPVIGMVSRLVDQKGVDLILDGLETLLSFDATYIFLGTGNRDYENRLKYHAFRSNGKLAVFTTFDNGLAHRIEAGSDLYLMPSRFEPCGLNQMYSLLYGTLPIVRHTGGLVDTVKNYNPHTNEGWGFAFIDANVTSLLETVRWAIKTYDYPETFTALARRAMRLDFSWEKSARAYHNLYKGIKR